MKTCINCNSKLNDNDHLCIYCGEKVVLNSTIDNGQNFTSKNLINELFKKEVKTYKNEQNKQTVESNKNNSVKKENLSYKENDSHYKPQMTSTSNLPKYQYWLLISSYLFSWTYIAPIIGIIASFTAYSDIETSNHEEKDNQKALTIGAGLLHGFFIILGMFSNGWRI